MSWASVWTSANLEQLLIGNARRGDPGGLLLTLMLGLVAIVTSTLLGTVLGLMRGARRRALRWPATAYVQTLRNIPLVILIFWAYFVPPYLGLEISKFLSVALALTLFTAAYIAEIVHGGVLSVPPGQIEAARALGLGPLQRQLWVVLPQAFFHMLPALTGRYITVIKNTSLAFLIGLSELTEIGKEVNARVLIAPVEVYLTLLIIYFAVNRVLSAAMLSLESLPRFNKLFMRI